MSNNNKKNTLPLTEALVFDIVEYLLNNEGFGFSNEISYHIVDNKPRRYTSREVVGILRNRPMFRHAKSEERHGGIRWRLDLPILERYLIQKGYNERFEKMGLSEMVDEMKKRIIEQTVEVIKNHNKESDINETYNLLSVMWS